uniref:Uncharacterized protein n=1 Tax=Chrysotila carterae TaxID=13221 RepID=A0A7S4B9U9_CHRCT
MRRLIAFDLSEPSRAHNLRKRQGRARRHSPFRTPCSACPRSPTCTWPRRGSQRRRREGERAHTAVPAVDDLPDALRRPSPRRCAQMHAGDAFGATEESISEAGEAELGGQVTAEHAHTADDADADAHEDDPEEATGFSTFINALGFGR